MENAEASKKKAMAVLGARLLEEQPKTRETAHAVGMRHEGEMSVLKRLAVCTSGALTSVLTWMIWWGAYIDSPEVTEAIAVQVNTQFLPTSVEPAYVQAMTAALEKDAISHEVFWYALLKADALPAGWTLAEEKQAIALAVTAKSDRAITQGRALVLEDDPHSKPREDGRPRSLRGRTITQSS